MRGNFCCCFPLSFVGIFQPAIEIERTEWAERAKSSKTRLRYEMRKGEEGKLRWKGRVLCVLWRKPVANQEAKRGKMNDEIGDVIENREIRRGE